MIPNPPHTKELSVAQCQRWLNDKNPPLLIDCRELTESAHSNISGAHLVPLSQFIGIAEAEFPTTDTPAIIYCHHGVRSLNAVYYLRDNGYSHTYSMKGGIDQWSLQIDPSIMRY